MADPTPSVREARAVLGVPGSATRAQVMTAFRRLARVAHPDVNQVPDAASRFAALVAAYRVALQAAPAPPEVGAGPVDARGARSRAPVSASPTPGGPHQVVVAGGATIVREAGRVVLVLGPVTVHPPSVGGY